MPLDQPDDVNRALDDESRMPMGEHLEDLRRHIIRALIGIGVALAITLYFGFHLVNILAQPLLQAQVALGFPPRTITTEPTAGFTSVYLPVSLIAAIILASPWVIYQLWSFIASGLYTHERRAMHILAPFSSVMVLLGVLFTYYILLPICLLFFLNFASLYPEIEVGNPNPVMKQFLRAYGVPEERVEPDEREEEPEPARLPRLRSDPADPEEGTIWINRTEDTIKTYHGGRIHVLGGGSNRLITPLPRLDEYVRFAAFMMLGVVIAFQVPVVMLVLGWTGLFDPDQVAKTRKYALFASLAAGAILTPTDIFSMFVLAVPLYLLFELGLVLMRWTNRRANQ